MVGSNSSGLLTTCGGSQELFAAGLAACGCQARSKQDASRRRLPGPQQTGREPSAAAREWNSAHCTIMVWRNCSGLLTTRDVLDKSALYEINRHSTVVRKSFFAAGFAACGCKARSKKTRAAAG